MTDGRMPHADHDAEQLVAYADAQLDAPEAALAADHVADCADCARLVDEVRLLAAADRALATPARPRDFRLTAADAERLRAPRAEPIAAAARLTGEMPATRPHAPDHAAHDALLVAASLDSDLTTAQRRTVDDWFATCAACADLRADLVAIAAAHRALPTPARPRDLRLTERDAARLRGGRWRDVIGWIGGARDGITRPLATGLTTLGLVGVLVTGGPALLASSGAAGAAGAPESQALGSTKNGSEADPQDGVVFTGEDPGTSIPAARPVPSSPEGTGDPVAGNAADPSPVESGFDTGSTSGVAQVDRSTASPGGVSPVDGEDTTRQMDDTGVASTQTGLLVSIGALLAGLAVFVTRRISRAIRGV